MHHNPVKELFLEELEPVFISWANRIPQKSLFLTILYYADGYEFKKENMVAIENLKSWV